MGGIGGSYLKVGGLGRLVIADFFNICKFIAVEFTTQWRNGLTLPGHVTSIGSLDVDLLLEVDPFG